MYPYQGGMGISIVKAKVMIMASEIKPPLEENREASQTKIEPIARVSNGT